MSIDNDAGEPNHDDQGSSRSSTMPRPEIVFGNENVQTVALTNSLGEIEGASVIEFYQTIGLEFVTDTNPLLIKIGEPEIPVDATRKLILVGYSASARRYFAVGTMNTPHEIHVCLLPEPSPSCVSGLGSSIKLFLLRVRSDFAITPYPGRVG